MRFDSFAKENDDAEMSVICHINQQRRDDREEKNKSCDSQKHLPQVQVLLDPSRSALRDTLNESHESDDTKPYKE